MNAVHGIVIQKLFNGSQKCLSSCRPGGVNVILPLMKKHISFFSGGSAPFFHNAVFRNIFPLGHGTADTVGIKPGMDGNALFLCLGNHNLQGVKTAISRHKFRIGENRHFLPVAVGMAVHMEEEGLKTVLLQIVHDLGRLCPKGLLFLRQIHPVQIRKPNRP